jgi:hypothetical protein
MRAGEGSRSACDHGTALVDFKARAPKAHKVRNVFDGVGTDLVNGSHLRRWQSLYSGESVP